VITLKCIGCGEEFPIDKVIYVCERCGDLLDIDLDYGELPKELDWRKRPLNVWRYRELLPVSEKAPIVTLGEGGTTLHKCSRLGPTLGLKHLYVKDEGENPTGSFKDRGMTVGVTKSLEMGVSMVACASTGNTASSLAAYASKAGLKSAVLVPAGRIAWGKLAQAMIYGAKVIAVRGNFDVALSLVMKMSFSLSLYLLNSVNPFRLEGQKTAALEINDQLEGAPDKVILPVGNAGNIFAYWKGFRELRELDMAPSLPQMIGVQAVGASPIAEAVAKGRDYIKPFTKPETIASAIRIGRPLNWKKALKAVHDSGGSVETVSDDEIISAQRLLAEKEGIFTEPAGAASVAGLIKLCRDGRIDKDEKVVCVATGRGLKDAEVIKNLCESLIEIEPELEAFERALKAHCVKLR
jgi:threonine synthase